jgi:hypothetical protein
LRASGREAKKSVAPTEAGGVVADALAPLPESRRECNTGVDHCESSISKASVSTIETLVRLAIRSCRRD